MARNQLEKENKIAAVQVLESLTPDAASAKSDPEAGLMTYAEARQCVEAIKYHAISLRQHLVSLESGRGWSALGYSSITACLVAEFPNSKPVLIRELKVGRIEKYHLQVPIGTYLESQMRPLSKLPSPQQYQPVIARAHQLAGSSRLTANHVTQAVTELRSALLSQIKPVTLPVCPYNPGDIILINCVRAVKEDYAKYNNCWGVVACLHSHGCIVQLMGQQWNIHSNDIKEIDLVDKTLKQVAPRICALLQRDDLDEMEREILERYHRRQWFTPWQLQLLQTLEELRCPLSASTSKELEE